MRIQTHQSLSSHWDYWSIDSLPTFLPTSLPTYIPSNIFIPLVPTRPTLDMWTSRTFEDDDSFRRMQAVDSLADWRSCLLSMFLRFLPTWALTYSTYSYMEDCIEGRQWPICPRLEWLKNMHVSHHTFDHHVQIMKVVPIRSARDGSTYCTGSSVAWNSRE